MGGDVAFDTGLPISRDRTVDDRGIELGHRRIVEPEPRHDARPKLLDDDIRAFDQGLQPGPFSSVFEVDGDAALAAIEQRKASAVVPPFGGTAAHLLTARRLDLDHLRARLGQQQRRQRPRQQGREVEDEQPFKRPHRTILVLESGAIFIVQINSLWKSRRKPAFDTSISRSALAFRNLRHTASLYRADPKSEIAATVMGCPRTT